ncbi:polysulfide reductase, partial [Streptomyces sp. NPDC006265]
MTGSDVTRNGIKGAQPGREAVTGVETGRRRRRRGRGEQPTVPEAQFSSYYGRMITFPTDRTRAADGALH